MLACDPRALLVAVVFLGCGPSETRVECEYAELEGTCALVEADDRVAGSYGAIRARYRLVPTNAPELGNHVVLEAECNPERHRAALEYFRDNKKVGCRVGVRTRGDRCPRTRIILDLPKPDRDLKLSYRVDVVSDIKARPETDRPYEDGKVTPWP